MAGTFKGITVTVLGKQRRQFVRKYFVYYGRVAVNTEWTHHSPSPPACTDHSAHRVQIKMATEGQSDYESVLCVKPEVNVYRIPPRASNRAIRWGPDGVFSDSTSATATVTVASPTDLPSSPPNRAASSNGGRSFCDACFFSLYLQGHYGRYGTSDWELCLHCVLDMDRLRLGLASFIPIIRVFTFPSKDTSYDKYCLKSNSFYKTTRYVITLNFSPEIPILLVWPLSSR